MQNPYRTLGILPSADYETARKRYISLAKKYHPDNFASSRKVSEDKMKQINNAFQLIKEEVLHDTETYKNYSFVPEKYFYEYFMPSFNMVFLILFSMAMIIYSPQLCVFLCMFYYMGHDVFNDY